VITSPTRMSCRVKLSSNSWAKFSMERVVIKRTLGCTPHGVRG
jgi:hypothetical protein